MKLAISILLTLVAITAFAGVPLQIQHQGYLLDGADQPVEGPATLTFQLYADSVGGSALWSETHTNVPVAGGLYNVQLGSSTPLTDAIFTQPQLWLGTRVNNDSEMAPRIRISSVPYALLARKLESFSTENLAQFLQLLNSTPDADGDGHVKMSLGGDDCDDLDPAVYAGAPEICDGKDNDCDRVIDEGTSLAYYRDADHDGYGVTTNQIFSCSPPDTGYSPEPGDCDDSDPARHPGAPELCDGADNDCDGLVDNGFQTDWYADTDADLFGDPNVHVVSCTAPQGYVATAGDCDDTNPLINPGAPEVCDGIDNDCNMLTDENLGVNWYADVDADGFGDPTNMVVTCAAPAGYVTDGTDCNDADAASHPGATELCDGADNDCDGLVDEDAVGGTTWYADADNDGFGNPDASVAACVTPPGYVSNNLDCDDANASVHPGATEACDGVDNDCDGLIDPQNSAGCTTFYRDSDQDGFGETNDSRCLCSPQAPYTATQPGDCNDFSAAVHPGAVEVCNGIDDNCDGLIDNGFTCPAGFHCAAGQCVPN